MVGNNKLPLNKAIENLTWKGGCVDVALYLMSHGCPGSNEDRIKLLCGACKHGKLDVVKELVEQHHIVPSGKYSTLAIVCRVHVLFAVCNLPAAICIIVKSMR